jgi:16S rRNA C967 or C1407 C5-methylase (RsmB/RsmF family)
VEKKRNKNQRNNKGNFSKNKYLNTSKNDSFLKKYKIKIENIYGKDSFSSLLNIQRNYDKIRYIRVNISKTTIEEVEKFLKRNRVKFSRTFLPNSLKIEKSFFNLSSSLLNLTGKIYIQDLASQFPVHLIDFKKLIEISKTRKVNILDMAAAPGSKTTQMADLLTYYNINYEIDALEPDKKRILRLINNIQKQSFKNINIYNEFGEKFNSIKKYDVILLDAPCSGNLIDDKNWLKKRDFSGFRKNSDLQKKLLDNANYLLKKGGQIIYSTCSFEIEENEENLDYFLKRYKYINSDSIKNFEKELLNKNLILKIKNFKDKTYFRLNSLNSKTQGFFSFSYFKK